jgi:nucleotide-binding universal stress UspA family protein
LPHRISSLPRLTGGRHKAIFAYRTTVLKEEDMTSTIPVSSGQEWQFETPALGGIVVGFDGSPASLAAIETAADISAAKGWCVHVVSVLSPMSSYRLSAGIDESESQIEDLRAQLRDAAIRDAIGVQFQRRSWTREVTVGKPAMEIAGIADQRHAGLIILGRSQRRGIERFLGGETATQVMRSTSVPVLLVDDQLHQPSTIVVAVDFRMASARAASIALELLGERGALYLVHVEEPVEVLPDGSVSPEPMEYPAEVLALFRRLLARLRPPPGIAVETVVLHGSPARAIAEFSERVGADLVAVGSRGLSPVARMILGSVSLGVARKVHAPILVAPAKN